MKLGGCETVIRLTTSYYCHGPENRWRRTKQQNKTEEHTCVKIDGSPMKVHSPTARSEFLMQVLCNQRLQFVPGRYLHKSISMSDAGSRRDCQ